MIDSVITALTIRDANVFVAGIQYIFKYIKFNKLIISVPDHDYDSIYNLLGHYSRTHIIKDSSVISYDEIILIKNVLAQRNLEKYYGWYLQQFIKIRLASNCQRGVVALIWDADTIPLRPINFIGADGSLNYFVGNEFHEPYFMTLKNILGLDKLTTYSFIAQSFPVYADHVKEFTESIGGNNKWIATILNCLSSGSPHLFSEYETLGNFLLSRYPHKVNFIFSRWERRGNLYFYFYRSIDRAIKYLSFDNSFVAFEKINLPFYRVFLNKSMRFFKNGF